MKTIGIVRPHDILQAVTGIDEHQPFIRLHQQAVRAEISEHALAGAIEQRPAERAMRSTIEVMDPHRPPQ